MTTQTHSPQAATGTRPPVLSAADHEHFLQHGYVIVKNVVPPEIMAAAVAALEEQKRRQGVGDGYTTTATPDEANACITDKMHDAIAALFGDAYPHDRGRGGNDMMRAHQPGADWPTPVAHVDDDYPTLMPNAWAVGSFLFLTPVQSHGGAFIYFDGSPNRFRQAMHRWPNLIKDLTNDVAYSGVYAELLAEPGDLLLFHHLCGHSGSNNVTDPRTRHALLGRWHPRRRIVPGGKPFDQMTTIEKANSPRYLREVLAFELASPVCPHGSDAAAVLREGWSGGAGIVTHSIVHHDGRTHLLYVDAAEPTVLRHATSKDLVHWSPAGRTEPGVGAIETVNLWQHMHHSHMVVTGREGGDSSACVMSHRDLDQWQTVETIPGCRAGRTFFTGKGYGSNLAWDYMLFLVSAATPSRLECRWHGGEKPGRATSVDFSRTLEVWQPPDGQVIRDFTLHATLGEQQYAFIFDLAASGDAPPRPHFMRVRETCKLEAPALPLAYTAPTPPRCVRPYMRAFNYWLVTYLRRHEGEDRLFFGAIDWGREPVELVELATPAAMAEAFAVVGLA
ncbi:MAG: phytanoyl-CoA dioxygenase family protein [Planctomycetes bacterium]|nr:phytanoyl-CoA dioxygenase family protein [Planctomycetota bacterium]